MFGVIRLGAYLVSALSLWNFFHGDSSLHSMPLHRHLALDSDRGMLLGVCAGISNYIGVDVTIVRFVWIAAALYRGLGILLYILAFLIMPS